MEIRGHDHLPVDQPQRRRPVRDGEVLLTLIRRDHQPDGEHGANLLDAARQARRSEAAAKERAERLLEEAQAMIRDLQTKLGHECLSKDEVLETVQRLETERQATAHVQKTAVVELTAERLARRNAEDALAEALAGPKEAEQRIRDAQRTPGLLAGPSNSSMTRSSAMDHVSPQVVMRTSRTPLLNCMAVRCLPGS
jgi:hypothetical protein